MNVRAHEQSVVKDVYFIVKVFCIENINGIFTSETVALYCLDFIYFLHTSVTYNVQNQAYLEKQKTKKEYFNMNE